MCKNRKIVEQTFQAVGAEPHLNFVPVYRMAAELLCQGRLEVIAGDCRFEDALEVLASEKHYTVCFYLQCESCGEIFFLGACIRGVPKYRKVDDIKDEKIEHLLWGREGSYFEKG